MLHRPALPLVLAALSIGLVASPAAAQPKDDGFVPLFDGKTLQGWDGNPKFWSVEGGAITGRTTADNPTDGNTFLVWTGGDVGDFELTLDYKIVGGNSGIQYRSFRLKDAADEWRIGGYQADIDSGDTYSGIVYGEKARGILSGRGESCTLSEGGAKDCNRFAESADIQAKIKKEDWNSYRIVAKGNTFTHSINGVKTTELVDNDAEGEGKRMAKGLLALQLHAGPPMTVQFKNVRLKNLDPKQAAALRLRIDERGGVELDGELVERTELPRVLGNLNVQVLREGVIIEADGEVPFGDVQDVMEKCRAAGLDKLRLRVNEDRVTVETPSASVDVNESGAVTVRAGDVGFGYHEGKGRVTVFGITAFEFGEEPEAEAPAPPEVDLGEPEEIDLGEERDPGSAAPPDVAERRVAATSDVIDLGIDAKGNLAVEGFDTEEKDLVQRLADEVNHTGGAELDFRAHESVSVERITELINLCHEAGIQTITMKAFVAAEAEPRKIVFIAGKRSHGYGAHEHRAGCLLLAEQLAKSGLPVETEVVTDGWPQDASVLDDADCIVIYADGGGGHPFNAHIDELEKLMEKGVGLVCIHYGVEVPAGKSGDAFLDWTGGYFEANWSVNPHWTANYDELPEHPITRGVKPFEINDEWYYHMRFREEMAGVTPILTDLPPADTLKRPDGPHSGNPAVRKAVLDEQQPQHTAWATEREDGGRGFGITGGHFHWNWGHDQMRKLVLNAIAWTAKVDVPDGGVPTQPVTVADLMANQDFDVPEDFNPARIEEMLRQWNGGGAE